MVNEAARRYCLPENYDRNGVSVGSAGALERIPQDKNYGV
jgi:hypothetical protein